MPYMPTKIDKPVHCQCALCKLHGWHRAALQPLGWIWIRVLCLVQTIGPLQMQTVNDMLKGATWLHSVMCL